MTTKRTYPVRICSFCGQEYIQSNHPVFCKENPNRKIRKTSNSSIKAKERGEKFIISEETRQKFSETSKGRKHTEKAIETIKIAMKKAVKENPNSYAGGYNRGRVKSILCSNGFTVLGKWEQKFVEFCIKEKIKIEQPNTGFSYIWEGERTYFPDFYLPEYDLWIEIKGLETERDRAKWKSIIEIHHKNFFVIDKNNINKLNEINWCNPRGSNSDLKNYEFSALPLC
jgi:hypothetical protein